MALTVRVITPDQTVLDGNAEEVILPSSSGQVGILTGHAPLLTALEAGVLRIRTASWENIAITGGFAEVEDNEVKVLVNSATKGADINVDEARSAFEAAQTALDGVDSSDAKAILDARKEFKRARAQLMAAGGMA